MRMSTERLHDPVGGRPRNQMMGHTHFLNPTQNHIKLSLTGRSRFLVICSGEKFSEQYSDKKII